MLAGVWYSLAAVAALAAEPWETVDDFQLVPGLPTVGAALGISPSGNVYSAGSGVTSPDGSTRTAVVRMTADAGQAWTSLPEFGDFNWYWAHYRGVTTDASGRLYVCGNGRLAGQPATDLGWIVRESVDGGLNWLETDDPFPFPGDTPGGCADIKAHPVTGDVYASGSSLTYGRVIRKRSAGAAGFTTVYTSGANDGGSGWSIGFHPDGRVFVAGDGPVSGNHPWLVLGSATGEAGTWEMMDAFKTAEWTEASARACVITGSGTIYVAGWAYSTRTQKRHWIVRSSHDGGVTWANSDDFSLGGSTLEVNGMTVDPAGNIHVCGQAEDEAGRLYWVVRQGTPQIHWNEQTGAWDSSLTWTLSDTFQLAPGQPARANDIAADARGNVFANGRGADADGVDHWLVRKLAGVGPRLSVLRTAASLQLAWSTDAPDFILQSASTLAGDGDWQDLNLSPAQINAQNVVSMETRSTAAFFRLRRP